VAAILAWATEPLPDRTGLNKILDKFYNRTIIAAMRDESADLLRRHGVQVTAQRLAVLAAVSRRPHGTAEDVARAVRVEIGAISRQAVYDALGVLADKGLIRRIQPAGSSARYEDRAGDNHHHLVCRTCGRMVDVDCAVGAAPCLTPADDAGYEVDEAEVVYWGHCPECLPRPRDLSGTEQQTGPVPTVPPRSDDDEKDRAIAHDQTTEP